VVGGEAARSAAGATAAASELLILEMYPERRDCLRRSSLQLVFIPGGHV
jgi:hypothetical protein